MQEHSRPVKPRDLGVIGADHLRRFCEVAGAGAESFRYRVVIGQTDEEIPFIVEAAFACAPEGGQRRRLVLGVNFAAALSNPYRSIATHYDGLETLLAEQRCDAEEPIVIVLHLVCARVDYQDRGKSSLVVDHTIADAVGVAVNSVTGSWAKQQKAEERNDRRAAERYRKEVVAAAKPVRLKNDVVGSGALYREIEAAAAASGCSIKALTVLSSKNDPYRLDTTVGHQLGAWLAEQIERFLGAEGRVHLRGLFYRIVAAADVAKPDGQSFTNTHDNWVWLQARAAKAARWLGYVPFNRICDERNEAPRLYLATEAPAAGDGTFTRGMGLNVPELNAVLPLLWVTPPRGRQPYRIIMIGEKSSLGEVLRPIAEMVQGELLLPTGEATDTMIAELAARAAEGILERAAKDDRPAVVLYFADFDPAGFQMPISVSRKLQALRALLYPQLEIRVYRVALTLEQVREFDLPSTPLIETEKRKTRWREVMQHEQTEIDALAALRPDDLRDIALDAVAPFYDFTLAARCQEAAAAWRAEAAARIDGHPSLAAARARIAAAHRAVEEAVAALHDVQADTYAELRDQLDIDDASFPAPTAQLEAIAPPPLFDTADDFATASMKLIAEKKYEDEGLIEENPG
jgi:hypothetical protein